MKTIKPNNFGQALKEVEGLDKDQAGKVKKAINASDRKHNHVIGVKIMDRPGQVKNDTQIQTMILTDDKLKKLNKNFKFHGFAKLIILHDASQDTEDETPVLHIQTESKIEAKIKAELEAKHKAEMDDLRAKLKAEAIQDQKETKDAGNDDVDVLVKFETELDSTVDELKEYAKDNEIDLSGLKNKADIQLAIGTWLNDQEAE
jgi:ribosomal protein S10